MITELTPEQIAKFPEYVRTWTAKGLSTKQMTQAEAEVDFYAFQKNILKKKNPAPVLLVPSPIHAWTIIEIVKSNKNWDVTKILQQADDLLNGRPTDITREKLDFIWPYFDGQFWSSYFSYFDYFKNECGISYNKNYEIMKKAVDYGMVFPITELCIVSQPFSVIKMKEADTLILHCEDGPALSYSGFCEVYALNGIRMPKEYVLTPADKITSEMVLKEPNADIRKELLLKVGVVRMIELVPNKVLDKRGKYTLYSLELSPEVKDTRFLKMWNSSEKCWHVEGVGAGINTVDDALSFRNNGWFVNPEVLT